MFEFLLRSTCFVAFLYFLYFEWANYHEEYFGMVSRLHLFFASNILFNTVRTSLINREFTRNASRATSAVWFFISLARDYLIAQFMWQLVAQYLKIGLFGDIMTDRPTFDFVFAERFTIEIWQDFAASLVLSWVPFWGYVKIPAINLIYLAKILKSVKHYDSIMLKLDQAEFVSEQMLMQMFITHGLKLFSNSLITRTTTALFNLLFNGYLTISGHITYALFFVAPVVVHYAIHMGQIPRRFDLNQLGVDLPIKQTSVDIGAFAIYASFLFFANFNKYILGPILRFNNIFYGPIFGVYGKAYTNKLHQAIIESYLKKEKTKAQASGKKVQQSATAQKTQGKGGKGKKSRKR